MTYLVFEPKREKVFDEIATLNEKVLVKDKKIIGIGSKELTRKLMPLGSFLLFEYIKRFYPNYLSLLQDCLNVIDMSNFKISADEQPCYSQTSLFLETFRFTSINDLVILRPYLNNYLSVLIKDTIFFNAENLNEVSDDKVRFILKINSLLTGLKGTNKLVNIFFQLIRKYNDENILNFIPYFVISLSEVLPPADINQISNEKDIIYVSKHYYKIESSIFEKLDYVPTPGNDSYQVQVLTKNQDFYVQKRNGTLKDKIIPSGYQVDMLYELKFRGTTLNLVGVERVKEIAWSDGITIVHYVIIVHPENNDMLFIGDAIKISGTTDLSDGSILTIYIDEISIGTTQVLEGSWSYNWIIAGTINNHTISVEYNENVKDEVAVRLALHTLAITSPATSEEITIGSDVTITGTTDFADGETVTIYKTIGGIDTQTGLAVVTSGGFSCTWTAAGDPGSLTLKAVCGGITATVEVELKAALTIVSPSENQQLYLGTAFNFEVTGAQSNSISVYIGSVLIGTVPVISGTASGTLTIPEKSFTFGTIYKVEDGQEIQISNIQSEKFRVVSGEEEKEIDVKLIDTNNYFDFTPTTSVEFWHPEVQQSYTTDLTATTSVEFEIVT